MTNDEAAKENSASFFKSVDSVPMHHQLASQPYSPLITLMTVDYLKTAQDLPGWGGVIPTIDFKRVINAGIGELAHGLYGEDRLLREIGLLRRIALHHGLEEYFDSLVANSFRKKIKSPFMGNGINPRAIFLDASHFGIHDIFEASYAASYLGRFYGELMPKRLLRTVKRSLDYFLASSGKGNAFPKLEY
jgi:hypothetical protein